MYPLEVFRASSENKCLKLHVVELELMFLDVFPLLGFSVLNVLGFFVVVFFIYFENGFLSVN